MHHRCTVSLLLSLFPPHNSFKVLLGTTLEYIHRVTRVLALSAF
jgi:hypothetical protein